MHDLHFAVVVGIDRYPGLGDLHYARNDAEEFRGWLVDPGGGGVPEANVHLVVAEDDDFSDLDDAHPKWHHVNAALRRVNEALKAALKDDPLRWVESRLYFFGSGHGITPDGGKAALLMADAALGSMGNNVELSRYADWYEKCATFREVVLLADCCRDRRDTAPSLGPPFDACPSQADPVNLVMGYATTMGDPAFEPEAHDPDAGRGYFTRALLDGLRGQAADPETRMVDSNTLSEYVHRTVPELTDDAQKARIEANPADPIVFRVDAAPARAQHVVTILLPAAFTGAVELHDGVDVLATWDAATGEWQVSLPDGLYGVRPAGGGAFPNDGLFRVAGGDRSVEL